MQDTLKTKYWKDFRNVDIPMLYSGLYHWQISFSPQHSRTHLTLVFPKVFFCGFPNGSVVKNLPTSAGDTDSIPDRGRSHRPWSTWVPVPRLLRLGSRGRKLQPLRPCAAATEAHAPRALQQEKPRWWGDCARQLENSPCWLQLEKSLHSNKDEAQPKTEQIELFF